MNINRKENPFFVMNMVDPSEYDWIKQFSDTAKYAYKNCEIDMVFDVGKVMGIVDAYWELLKDNKLKVED